MLTFLLNPFLWPFFVLIFYTIKWQLLGGKPTKNGLNPPPSPTRLPIIGNFHQLGTLPHQFLHSLSVRYGPIMLIHLGNVPTVVVSSPELAREVMKTHDITFASRPESKMARKLLYDHKTVSSAPYGEYWRKMKSIMVVQLLSTKRVRFIRSIRDEETENLLKIISCSKNEQLNLSELFVTYTNNVTCRVVLGRKYGEGESGKKFKQLLREFLVVLGSFSVGDFIPQLAWVDRVNGFDAKVERIAKEIDTFIEGVVNENKNKNNDATKSFVDIVLELQKDDSARILHDTTNVKALLLDTYTAGTDTTATVLEWVMAELLRHPSILKKTQDEVRTVFKNKTALTEEDLEQMKYLKAVIKETLRLHPPLPMLVPTVASKDVKIMGYDIAKGTTVMTNVWAIGRDPKHWVEPEVFRPERFLGSSIDFKGHDFELIPFGAGRRICPGIVFAMTTNENLIANLLCKFDWKSGYGGKGEDLDMSECPGIAVRKRVPLLAIATSV